MKPLVHTEVSKVINGPIEQGRYLEKMSIKRGRNMENVTTAIIILRVGFSN